MHQLDESPKILGNGVVIHDDEGRAFLRADALVRIIQAGKRPHRSSCQAGDGCRKNAGEPYPNGHVARQSFSGCLVSLCARPTTRGRGKRWEGKRNTDRLFRRACVFSRVLETMDPTRAAVKGPMGGDWVKWPSRQMRAAEKHRSSMDSERVPTSPLCWSPRTGICISDNCVMSVLRRLNRTCTRSPQDYAGCGQWRTRRRICGRCDGTHEAMGFSVGLNLRPCLSAGPSCSGNTPT